MTTLNLSIAFDTKKLLVMSTILAGAYFTFSTDKIHAQSNNAPNGSCALIMNSNLSGWDASLDNHSVPQSSLAIVNFDSSTVSFVSNKVTNYNQTNAALTQDTGTVNFTITNGPFSGSFYLTEAGAVSPIFLVPVNNGNSYLAMVLNSDKPSKTGVCQKI